MHSHDGVLLHKQLLHDMPIDANSGIDHNTLYVRINASGCCRRYPWRSATCCCPSWPSLLQRLFSRSSFTTSVHIDGNTPLHECCSGVLPLMSLVVIVVEAVQSPRRGYVAAASHNQRQRVLRIAMVSFSSISHSSGSFLWPDPFAMIHQLLAAW